MAGDDDRRVRAADRRRDSPDDAGAPDGPGQRAVVDGGAVGDLQEPPPDSSLERGPPEVEREVEAQPLAGEVLIQLADRARERRGAVAALIQRSGPAGEVQAGQAPRAGKKGERSQRALVNDPERRAGGVARSLVDARSTAPGPET